MFFDTYLENFNFWDETLDNFLVYHSLLFQGKFLCLMPCFNVKQHLFELRSFYSYRLFLVLILELCANLIFNQMCIGILLKWHFTMENLIDGWHEVRSILIFTHHFLGSDHAQVITLQKDGRIVSEFLSTKVKVFVLIHINSYYGLVELLLSLDFLLSWVLRGKQWVPLFITCKFKFAQRSTWSQRWSAAHRSSPCFPSL